MKKIKLTTPNPDFPLVRQTPNNEGIWKNCIFYLNRDIEECDYWVIVDNLSKTEKTYCSKENVILFTGEPPSIKNIALVFSSSFIQLSRVIGI